MANPNNPSNVAVGSLAFGFQRVGVSNASAPTFGLTQRRIAAGDTNAIYYGDPVMPVVSTATGYITYAPSSNNASTVIAGIFYGCEYLSTSQKRKVWSRYWPGADATGDVIAWICDDPTARFRVLGNSTTFNVTGTATAWTSSVVGQFANYTLGSGSTATGASGAYLGAVNTTNTFPFIVVDLVTAPPGSVGADPTQAYNHVIVGFNNEWLRSNAGSGLTAGIS